MLRLKLKKIDKGEEIQSHVSVPIQNLHQLQNFLFIHPPLPNSASLNKLIQPVPCLSTLSNCIWKIKCGKFAAVTKHRGTVVLIGIFGNESTAEKNLQSFIELMAVSTEKKKRKSIVFMNYRPRN